MGEQVPGIVTHRQIILLLVVTVVTVIATNVVSTIRNAYMNRKGKLDGDNVDSSSSTANSGGNTGDICSSTEHKVGEKS